ncbi:MAG: tetratricopeptide repeat protein [Planctomycetota bacterium]
MHARFLVPLVLLAACGAPGGIADEPLAPSVAESALARGIREVEAGRTDLGVLSLRRALELLPTEAAEQRAEAYRWIGHAFVREGDPEGALAELNRALDERPDDPWTFYACGTAWSTMGELDSALACFTRAIELDPAHIKALQWRGETWLELERPAPAVDDFSAALLAIEAADDAALARWGARRVELLETTLRLRARAYSSSGDEQRAALDRARREELLANLRG